MVFDNLEVKHNKFGFGTVVSYNGKYIRVRFSECEKDFVYPDAFAKFLTLSDGSVSDEINADIAASNSKKAAIKAMKEQEVIHSMTHGIVIPGKEMLSDNDDDERGFKNNSDTDEV